jgi:anti-anti-sigma regulatory factor
LFSFTKNIFAFEYKINSKEKILFCIWKIYIFAHIEFGMAKFDIQTRLTSDKNGYEFLAKFYRVIRNVKPDEHIIDFSNCVYFDANLAAALGAILGDLKELGHKFKLRISRKSKIFDTLARNGFLNVWEPKMFVAEKENFIKYQQFLSNQSNEFKQYIDEWLMRKQRFPKHTKLAGDYIQENIYEIYANAIGHGDTKYVYSCGEYKPESNTLDMTIVDCGKTIPYNVNEYMRKTGQEELDPQDAIDWAFIDGNTTKKDTGGLGLGILKDFIRMNKGCLHMISGNAFLEFSDTKNESIRLEPGFPGTIVNMQFRFDDDKNYYMESEKRSNMIDFNDLL